jgi:hypothetical protein
MDRWIVGVLVLALCALAAFLATLYGPDSLRQANPLRRMTNIFKNSEVGGTHSHWTKKAVAVRAGWASLPVCATVSPCCVDRLTGPSLLCSSCSQVAHLSHKLKKKEHQLEMAEHKIDMLVKAVRDLEEHMAKLAAMGKHKHHKRKHRSRRACSRWLNIPCDCCLFRDRERVLERAGGGWG